MLNEMLSVLLPGIAALKSKGVLQFIKPHFETMMQGEWPDWDGISLSEGLLHNKTRSSDVFPGNSLLAKAEWLGECTLIKLRAKSPIDGLSEREKTVEKCLLMGKPTKRSPEGYAVFLPLPAIIFSQSI